MEGACARIDGDCVSGPGVRREFPLEGGYLLPEDVLAAFQDPGNRCGDLFLDPQILGLQVEERNHTVTSLLASSTRRPRSAMERVAASRILTMRSPTSPPVRGR